MCQSSALEPQPFFLGRGFSAFHAASPPLSGQSHPGILPKYDALGLKPPLEAPRQTELRHPQPERFHLESEHFVQWEDISLQAEALDLEDAKTSC